MTSTRVPPATSTVLADEPHDDTYATVTFLRAQASWLARGLTHGTDPTAVGLVLGAHERAHERWVDLIASLHQRLGADAAQTVATLYAYHGRVAGSLERGPGFLDPDTAAVVRNYHAERLLQLTEVTVAALARHADGV